ncbi:MAG: hypothetical protein E6J47_01195 [Chloroflexi bacterium]|nr:MAG: hypothetical protein E6J47_01195 [Chloroflexota bacterium]
MPLPIKVNAAAPAERTAAGDVSGADAERLAVELERRGLAAPAALLLDAHRPLVPLMRQASIFLGPFLAPVAGTSLLRGLRGVLDQPELYDALARRLRAGKR